MKVAIYSGTIPSTSFIENLIESLAAHEVEIYLFGTRRYKKKYEFENIRIFPTPKGPFEVLFFVFWSLLMLSVKSPGRIRPLLNHLRFRKGNHISRILWLAKALPIVLHLPDIFHVQWAKSIGNWLFLKELYGVQLALSLRGSQINYSPVCDTELSRTFGEVLPKVDAFHAVCLAMKNKVLKYEIEPERIRVIYSGISRLDIDSRKSSQSSPGTKGTLRLLSVGRFHWIKGYNYALDACRIMKDRGLDFTYKIIAAGDPGEALYHIDDLNIGDVVEVIQEQPQIKVFQELSNSDALLLPSVDEGIANVAVEAMLSRTIVISTDSGGMAEVVNDRETGFLVPPRSAEALAQAVLTFRELPVSETSRIQDQAFDLVTQKFDLGHLGLEMNDLYGKMIEKVNRNPLANNH